MFLSYDDRETESMQKIISLIVFIFALSWTWNIIHSSNAVGFETHSGIQEKLSEIITNTIQTKRPKAQNIQIDKIWTETLNENKVKAVFRYSFVEQNDAGEVLNQSIEGEAILHREPTESTPNEAPVEKWVLQNVKTTQDSVEFNEGTVITPGGNDAETTDAKPSETTQDSNKENSKKESSQTKPEKSEVTPQHNDSK